MGRQFGELVRAGSIPAALTMKKKTKTKKEKCECGEELPHHLVEVADGLAMTHICICERRYRVKDGKFVQDGTESNPFANCT